MTNENSESTGQDKVQTPASGALARPAILPAAGHGFESTGGNSGEGTRRRLVKSALAAGPVVLALRGQSALAGTGCASPSRIFSGNLSPGHTPPPCGLGLSPGYWKVCQHLAEWASPGAVPALTAPTFSGSCSSGMPNGNRLTEGTLFGQISPFVNSGTLSNYGAWRILAYPSQVDKELSAFNMNQVQLARHLIATYLNLKKVGSTFPLTLAHMKAMWEQGSVDKYCPIGTGCTTAQLWTAQQVVCYLRNYTMDPASFTLNPDPITWIC